MCRCIAKLFLSVLVASVVVGCSKESDKSIGSTKNTLDNVSYVVTDSKNVTRKELIEPLGEEYEELFEESDDELSVKTRSVERKDELTYALVRYTYKTKNEKGEDIELSAVFATPHDLQSVIKNKLRSPKCIHIDCHYTITSNQEAPTKKNPQAFMFIGLSTLVVAPDYVGFGSTVDKDQQYGCEKLTATQTLDAVRAAIKILKDEYNTELDTEYYSIVTGYSQGGAVAVAVTKEIETMSEKEKNIFDFRLKYAFCGGGPYDPIATMDWWFNQTNREVQYPVAGPLILKGQVSGNPDLFTSVKYEDYLTEKYKNSGIEDAYNAKSLTTTQINNLINEKFGNKSLNNLFKTEFFDQYKEGKGTLATPIIESLKRNVLTDGAWLPKTPMFLYHVKNDKVVPFVNYENAVKAWGGRGILETHAVKLSENGKEHVDGGIQFYAYLMFKFTLSGTYRLTVKPTN